MKKTYSQLFSLILATSILAIPTLAFSGNGPKHTKYTADLYHGDTVYGKVVFNTNHKGPGYELEVEVEECTPLAGTTVEVLLHQSYYNMILVGELEVDSEGNGEATFNIDLYAHEFTLLVEGPITLSTSEGWTEWVKPVKDLDFQVSPKTVNQKSNGKWVQAKVFFLDGEVANVILYVNEIEVEDIQVEYKNSKLQVRFSRSRLIRLSEPGKVEVKLTFKLDGEPVELTDIIKVIHQENQETTLTQEQVKQNNGKAKGKTKPKPSKPK